jgi:hypothetical protein
MIIDLGICPRAVSALDLVRAELARMTSMYFAGAPVYDRMHALEEQLFNMMHPFSHKPVTNFHVGDIAGIKFHDE